VTVWAYEDPIGDITSQIGVARVGSWANVRGSVEGEMSAVAFAFESFDARCCCRCLCRARRTSPGQCRRDDPREGRVEVTAGKDVTSYYLSSTKPTWSSTQAAR
jgi:hypothetical protein